LQQRDVWEGWLSAEVRAYYFADLRQRCERHQQLTTWFTLAASSGAAVTLLGMFAETAAWIPAVLATAAGRAEPLVSRRAAREPRRRLFRSARRVGAAGPSVSRPLGRHVCG